MRRLATVLLSAVLASCAGGAGERSSPSNVLLVLVDTLRADRMSVYGYHRDTTPVLREWARGGTVFEHAWAMASWTKPSVAMLFTSRATTDNGGVIPEAQASLTEMLRGHGLRTAAVIGNPIFDPRGGSQWLHRGFEQYRVSGSGPPPPGRAARVTVVPDPPGVRRLQEPPSSPAIARAAITLLEQISAERFFLYVHFLDPHVPYRPVGEPRFAPEISRARRAAMASALGDEDRPLLSDEAYRSIERERALYDAEVAETDAAIGELLGALKRSGVEDRTLVVVTADHGEGLWQRPPPRGETGDGLFPQLYRGHGIMLHSEQVRVPLIFRGPGVPAGARREEQVTLLDVVPTILGALAIEPDEPLDGRDLFSGKTEAPSEVYAVCSRSTTVTVDGRWRLHQPRAHMIEKHGARPLLYDLVADPLEREPVDDPQRVAALAGKVMAWRERHAPAAPVEPLAPEERERLRMLGYFGEADRAGSD